MQFGTKNTFAPIHKDNTPQLDILKMRNYQARQYQ
jgi:hypothetical protein